MRIVAWATSESNVICKATVQEASLMVVCDLFPAPLPPFFFFGWGRGGPPKGPCHRVPQPFLFFFFFNTTGVNSARFQSFAKYIEAISKPLKFSGSVFGSTLSALKNSSHSSLMQKFHDLSNRILIQWRFLTQRFGARSGTDAHRDCRSGSTGFDTNWSEIFYKWSERFQYKWSKIILIQRF